VTECALAEAVERLYTSFAVSQPTWIECAPYGLSEQEVRRLLEVPLRELTEGHLHNYIFDMEAIGDENVFLYFLPRLLELASQRELDAFDAERVLHHLERGRGGPVTPAQTQAVQAFLGAWWRHSLTTEVGVEASRDVWEMQALLLTEGADLPTRLHEWREHPHPNAVWHLAVFLWWSLIPQAGGFDVHLWGQPGAEPELREWVSDPAVGQRLEDAFFADPDGPAAELISDVLTKWRGCVLGSWGAEE